MDVEVGAVEPLGKRIRQFFRDLFGSRVTEHLEVALVQLRQDFERRLQDKDVMVSSLREEKAMLMSKITLYELTIMPHASRTGAEVVAYQKPKKPNFSFVDVPPEKSRWERVQDEHNKQMAEELAEEAKKKEEPAVRNFAGEQGAG
jgi:hypothetical protein